MSHFPDNSSANQSCQTISTVINSYKFQIVRKKKESKTLTKSVRENIKNGCIDVVKEGLTDC